LRYLIDRYVTVRSMTLVLLDILVMVGATVTAVWLRLGESVTFTLSVAGYLYAIVLIIVVHMAVLYYHELYALKGQVELNTMAVSVAQSVAIASVLLFGLYYLVPQLAIGRGIFIFNLVLLPPLLTATRMVYLWLGNREALLQRIAVLGELQSVDQVWERLQGGSDYRLIGAIISEGESDKDAKVPVLGTLGNLRQLVSDNQIDGLIVAMRERRGHLPLEDLLYLKLLGIRVDNQDDFLERVTGQVPVTGLPPSSLVFSDGFRRIDLYQRLKDVPDRVMAVIMLVLLSPFLAMVALAIRIDSPGPVLYRQTRVGRAGVLFQIIKFRTMREDAEKAGAQFAGADDPRITRLGNVLRKLRIDELPQLINVIKGEMSFVGPRPERPEFVSDLQRQIPYYYLRTIVRPGITGWAQIRYPYGETLTQHREKLEHDLYYIKHISITLDILIALDTVRVMLFARGSR
jgi:sugar transferase (PEP-CTERM system associated)